MEPSHLHFDDGKLIAMNERWVYVFHLDILPKLISFTLIPVDAKLPFTTIEIKGYCLLLIFKGVTVLL
jgi:hypothetical protein